MHTTLGAWQGIADGFPFSLGRAAVSGAAGYVQALADVDISTGLS